MPDQNVSLHRVRGLVSGANWRATKFSTAVPHHLACGLCGIISRTTFLLPCFHTLCESCVSQSANDGDAVCPFDEQPFTAGEYQKFQLPQDTSEKLKAYCWNESHGCTFIGTLQAVLVHYEEHCTFHVVPCPRCRGPVLQNDLPRHYRAGCHGENNAPGAEQPTRHRRLVPRGDGIRTQLDYLSAHVSEPYEDQLTALESKINEILEESRNIVTHVEALAGAFNTIITHPSHGTVLQQDLPPQCRAGCQSEGSAFAAEQPAFHQGITLSADDILTSLDELKALIRDPYQDRLPALQSKMNEVLEETRNIGTEVEAIRGDFTRSELRLTQSLGELSRKFGSDLRSLEAGLCDSLKKHCDLGVMSAQMRHNGAQIDAIAGILREADLKLRDQLTQSRHELSASFGQELRTQLSELAPQPTKTAGVGRNDARDAGTTGTGEIPWSLEKRLILRKLELLATDSFAYVEFLRMNMLQQGGQFFARFKPCFRFTPNCSLPMSPFMGKLEGGEEGYFLVMANVDTHTFWQPIGLFTRWYCRDKYLQAAAAFEWFDSTLTLKVYLKWGGTFRGSCSSTSTAKIIWLNSDRSKQGVIMTKSTTEEHTAEARCGFRDIFSATMLDAKRSEFLRDGQVGLHIYLPNNSPGT